MPVCKISVECCLCFCILLQILFSRIFTNKHINSLFLLLQNVSKRSNSLFGKYEHVFLKHKWTYIPTHFFFIKFRFIYDLFNMLLSHDSFNNTSVLADICLLGTDCVKHLLFLLLILMSQIFNFLLALHILRF